MTVTALNLPSKKPDPSLYKSEVEIDDDDEPAELPPWAANRSAMTLLAASFVVVILASIGTWGLLWYREHNTLFNSHRYQAFCSVPVDYSQVVGGQSSANYRPVVWYTNIWSDRPRAATPVESEGNLTLNEVVDIDDGVDTITVIDGDRQVDFVHDFNSNYTSIIDEYRCLLFGLNPEMVMDPEELRRSIENGDEFDTSRVLVMLQAMLPPMNVHDVTRRCAERPVYLLREAHPPIRKRSTSQEVKKPDYIHFAGKHVQEIEITNLAELLDYEKKLKEAKTSLATNA